MARSARPGGAGQGALAFAHRQDQPVDLVQEAGGAVHALGVPFQIPFRRGGEQGEEADRVRAVALDQLVGINHIALGLGHLGPVLDHHALGEQVLKGLVDAQVAEVAQDLGEKAGIEQVEDGVLHAADVLIHRQPVLCLRRVQRRSGAVRAGVAGEVPGRLDKGVHGVGLAPRRAAAGRAGGGDEASCWCSGAWLPSSRSVPGRITGNCSCRHRHDAADRAVDDRDRRAPVALAGDAPVAQAVGDLGPAETLLLAHG